jgi:hypothetical protein
MERWNNGIKITASIIPIFQHPIFPLLGSLLRQGHDDVGVPRAIEV